MLDVQVRTRLGSFRLDASTTVAPGTVTVLVGESGSGKTTLLRLVAGLLEPDEGRIVLDGRVLSDRAAGVFVPPEERPVGYVAQDYALFPHLSVAANVAFGLRASRLPMRVTQQRTRNALERFGLVPLAQRRPHQLSGGQQQRVALARALVLDPAILLLDEPFSALDVTTRRRVRGELHQMLEGLPCSTLYVTHHPTEALAFGDRITVLESGRVSQVGTREDFVRHPRSQYVAEFLGVNLLEGVVQDRPGDGLATVRVGDGLIHLTDGGHEGAIQLVIQPHDIFVSVDRPAGSARNVLHGAIEELIPEPPAGEQVRILISTYPPLAAQVTQQAVAALGLHRGMEVFASFKATAVNAVP